jgi:hypothetical protein
MKGFDSISFNPDALIKESKIFGSRNKNKRKTILRKPNHGNNIQE